MRERVLIIGVAGFVGAALERQARAAGAACLGVGRAARDRADYRTMDLAAGADELVRLLAEWRPERVYHLAGGPAGDPFAANVKPTLHLIEALRRVPEQRPRVEVSGSAAEYGDLGAAPIAEDARERPVNAYGVAKLAQTRLALAARRAGMRVTVARPFNIMGPGMSPGLAPARFAREALAARAAGRREITVGDLSTLRDYLDVEDVARALWAIGAPEVEDEIVNVCSGVPISTGDVLNEIVRQSGASLTTRTDPGLVKGPEDIPVSIGCADRLHAIARERFAFSLPRAVGRIFAVHVPHV
jgi:nucleoside-diphosphate-sugar epimerase